MNKLTYPFPATSLHCDRCQIFEGTWMVPDRFRVLPSLKLSYPCPDRTLGSLRRVLHFQGKATLETTSTDPKTINAVHLSLTLYLRVSDISLVFKMSAMFSQNPLMNGPNYSFNQTPSKAASGEYREHRFNP